MPVTPRRPKRRRVIKSLKENDANLYGKFRPLQPKSDPSAPKCYGCHRSLDDGPYVLCAECAGVSLCLACFSVGAYLSPHEWSHSYRVISPCPAPIFAEDWSATEETKLIDALLTYGIHDWSNIARAVSTKSKSKCEQHYYEVYLDSPKAPLPDDENILPPRTKRHSDLEASDDDMSSLVDSVSGNLNTLTDGELSNRSLRKSQRHAIAGYLPKRADFDVEFNDGAEAVLADLEITPEDTPEEAELKFRLIEIYNVRLEDRERKKSFLLNRNLLDFERMRAAAYRGSKDERELSHRLRAWAKLQSPDEQADAEKKLLNEWRLLKELGKVKRWSETGITTKAEGEAVEKLSTEKAGRHRKSFEKVDNACYAPLDVLDVEELPGVDKLTFIEREICSALRITPASFISLRDTVLDSVRNRGPCSPSDVTIVKFDPSDPNTISDVKFSTRSNAENAGYLAGSRLRAKRRRKTNRLDKTTFYKWVKVNGRVRKIRLRKGIRVDRWGVTEGPEARENAEDFWDEPFWIPSIKYDSSSDRENCEDFFDKQAGQRLSSSENCAVLDQNAPDDADNVRAICATDYSLHGGSGNSEVLFPRLTSHEQCKPPSSVVPEATYDAAGLAAHETISDIIAAVGDPPVKVLTVKREGAVSRERDVPLAPTGRDAFVQNRPGLPVDASLETSAAVKADTLVVHTKNMINTAEPATTGSINISAPIPDRGRTGDHVRAPSDSANEDTGVLEADPRLSTSDGSRTHELVASNHITCSAERDRQVPRDPLSPASNSKVETDMIPPSSSSQGAFERIVRMSTVKKSPRRLKKRKRARMVPWGSPARSLRSADKKNVLRTRRS